MHIEPGIVSDSKIGLSYITALGVSGYAMRCLLGTAQQQGAVSLALRSVIAAVLVFCFFQVLPHYSVGVSEVHLILGSTLFLALGLAPAAVGLAAGLLLQGVLFSPHDLPQYGMNVTTLLVPLFALQGLAKRIIAPDTPYVELRYSQALALSTAYQAGIVSWVAFWAFYGRGFSIENLSAVASFGGAYMLVVVVEPLVDLAVLAAAKGVNSLRGSRLVDQRMFEAA